MTSLHSLEYYSELIYGICILELSFGDTWRIQLH